MTGLHHLIELVDPPSGEVDLLAIVELLEHLDLAGTWSILALAATPIARPSIDLRTLLDLGRRPAAGYPVSVAMLRGLAENTLEISDALVVRPRDATAAHDAAASERLPPPAQLAASSDLDVLASSWSAIARVDSGRWRVWLPDAWLAPFALAFPGSREREPASTPLTA